MDPRYTEEIRLLAEYNTALKRRAVKIEETHLILHDLVESTKVFYNTKKGEVATLINLVPTTIVKQIGFFGNANISAGESINVHLFPFSFIPYRSFERMIYFDDESPIHLPINEDSNQVPGVLTKRELKAFEITPLIQIPSRRASYYDLGLSKKWGLDNLVSQFVPSFSFPCDSFLEELGIY